MNRHTILGNLASNATLRETQSGPVANFRVITNEQVGGRNYTEGHNCVLFGKRAAGLVEAGLLNKGQEVMASGRVQHRSFEGQDKKTKYITEIVVWDFTPLRRPNTQRDEEVPTSEEDYGD